MKTFLIYFFFLPLTLFAQKKYFTPDSLFTIVNDSIYNSNAYTAYYSNKIKAPLLVSYKLYKGGGSCGRDGLSFEGNKHTATSQDYEHTGYDKGHLANSEDFANNCKNDASTFRYWNCFPQTPLLNRGLWKVQETSIRKLSQNDTLIVLCGGFYNHLTIGHGVGVPDTCWKIVYSKKQKAVIQVTTFTNNTTPVRTDWNYNSLSLYIKKRYKINVNNFFIF